MTSWRKTASQEAHDDLDGLLSAAVPFAQDMLKQRDEFYPFAARVAMDGTVAMVAGAPDSTDRPASTDLIELRYEGLKDLASESRAVAVATDVSIARKEMLFAGRWNTETGSRDRRPPSVQHEAI